MPTINITSNSIIAPEQHFRIFAGPGAGKTHLLVNHLKYVLQHSQRLDCSKKIACITYTNIGVETIIKRLKFGSDRIEVSTIHGFIYHNIIKPYMSFIAERFNFNVHRMDGHDDHIISRSKIKAWLTSHISRANFRHPYSYEQLTRLPQYIPAIGNWLASMQYKFIEENLEFVMENGKAFYIDDNGGRVNLSKVNCLDKLLPGLMDYKKIFWEKGILHHDDVLYFGYILLSEYPFIAQVIRAKFPYFFIDEFQDTSPIQSRILRIIGEAGIITGIIGDEAQSIYSFQGADPVQFRTLQLANIQDYQILDNKRSTIEIINVLNYIRQDLVQISTRNTQGERCQLLIGDYHDAVEHVKQICAADLTILTWDNITANELKNQMTSEAPTNNLIDHLYSIDDSIRRSVILSCLRSIEFAKEKRFKDAIKEMEINFRNIANKDIRKAKAIEKLTALLSNYENIRSAPLYDFFTLVRSEIKSDFTNLSGRGAAREFYNSHTYEQVAVCLKIEDDRSPSKTIHKSKGDEFNNVLLVLKKESELDFILKRSLTKEEYRLFYVAISRAKERLFISIPELAEVKQNSINHLFDSINI